MWRICSECMHISDETPLAKWQHIKKRSTKLIVYTTIRPHFFVEDTHTQIFRQFLRIVFMFDTLLMHIICIMSYSWSSFVYMFLTVRRSFLSSYQMDFIISDETCSCYWPIFLIKYEYSAVIFVRRVYLFVCVSAFNNISYIFYTLNKNFCHTTNSMW